MAGKHDAKSNIMAQLKKQIAASQPGQNVAQRQERLVPMPQAMLDKILSVPTEALSAPARNWVEQRVIRTMEVGRPVHMLGSSRFYATTVLGLLDERDAETNRVVRRADQVALEGGRYPEIIRACCSFQSAAKNSIAEILAYLDDEAGLKELESLAMEAVSLMADWQIEHESWLEAESKQ